ncbi:hypothetical protein JCM3766R1_002068 [Sporobolomyces carnicolor]
MSARSSRSKATLPDEVIDLVPFDPDDPVQVETLTQQRVLCGWQIDMVDTWREQARRNVKGLYWIMPADTELARTRLRFPLPEREELNMSAAGSQAGSGLGPPAPHQHFRPLGHASLDWEDYERDASLADRENGVITIATFYILNSQQGLGLGNVVMKALERKAIQQGARQVTLNTLCSRAAASLAGSDSPLPPDTRLNESWYERLGYEAYKREPRYKDQDKFGRPIKLTAVFMRKPLA